LQSNDEFVEILFWMDAFKRANALSCTLIMPYFGYGKGDKKDEPRVSIRARVCAECMELAGADRFVTMDLHAPQLQGFWKKPVDHLFALPMLTEVMKRLDTRNAVVVSPDAGFAKQARKFADALNLPIAIGDKTRTDHTENAKVLEVIGDVEGKNCLVVDDFSISGGTMIDIARGLKEKGAKRIFNFCTFGLFTDGFDKFDKAYADGVIDKIFTTNLVYRRPELADKPWYCEVNMCKYVAYLIDTLNHDRTISGLLDPVKRIHTLLDKHKANLTEKKSN
jgi:ribose-phosphate pyrophosphokinase